MRLIEYLEHARKLENDIYMCDVTINNLENRITELENERKYKQQLRDSNIQPIKREILKPEIPKGQTKENAIGCLISILCSIFITFPIAVIIGASCLVDLLSLLSYDGDDTVSYKIASDIIMLILSICIALFPIIVRIATSISQKRDYNKRLKEYREECSGQYGPLVRSLHNQQAQHEEEAYDGTHIHIACCKRLVTPIERYIGTELRCRLAGHSMLYQ